MSTVDTDTDSDTEAAPPADDAPATGTAAGNELKEAVAEAALDSIVERYIKMRDRQAELKKKFKEETEALDAGLAKCEKFFLGRMNTLGLEALPTKFGTPYKTHKTSAAIGDGAAFLTWVRTTESWGYLDLKANKTAVVAHIAEHQDLPPGVAWRDEIAVNVKRS